MLAVSILVAKAPEIPWIKVGAGQQQGNTPSLLVRQCSHSPTILLKKLPRNLVMEYPHNKPKLREDEEESK